MSDEEDTWDRKRRVMSSDDRALQSASRRRQRAPAIPAPFSADDPKEPTSPHDLMDRPLDEAEDRLATRLRRDSEDPIKTLSEAISKLTHRLDRVQRESESGVREQHKQLAEILKGPKPSWLTIGTFATLAGLVVGMAGFLYSRGASEEAQRMRIDYLERRLEETRSDAKDQRPRWPLPTIKDASP